MIKTKTILNTLAYAIALLALIPLFPYLELTPQIVFPAALAAGIMIDLREWPVGHRLPTLLSLVFFIFYVIRFDADNVVGPAVNLLVILLAVRLLSEKTARNYLQIYALSLFSLAGSSLFDLSPLFLCYFLLMLTLIAVCLVILTYHTTSANQVVSRPALRKLLSVALLIPAASIPLIVLFFFVLPRTQYPLWDLRSKTSAVTGFSEKVDPGSSKVVENIRKVAFRVKSPKLPSNVLYWRGIVLNSFEGKAWVRTEPPGDEDGFAVKRKMVRQTFFPEPGRAAYLIALNMPRSISGTRFSASPDLMYVKTGSPNGHEKYETVSSLTAIISSKKGIDPAFYLHVPNHLSTRMVAVATSIAEKAKDDAEKAALLEQFFHSKKLKYAKSDLPVGEDPLDEFLFEKRSGHCEFFASSFAVLLRATGVPSRLVGGYYGGDYNDLGGYYVVTEDKAHVWVEAYIADKGWVTIDPSQWSINFAGSGGRGSRGLLQSIPIVADTFSYYWNLAVINYDLERQMRLISDANNRLKGLSVSLHPGHRWGLAILPVIAAVALFLIKRRPPITPEERVLRKFLAKVQKEYDLKRDSSSGLHQFVGNLNDPCADLFASTYEAAIYRDRQLTSEELTQLKTHVKGLHNSGKRGFHRGRGLRHLPRSKP